MAKKINIPAVRNATTQKIQQDLAIKEKISVKEELRDLIPPLQEEEYAQLEENIIKQGCREPLLLWRQGEEYVLVDGHNRFSICQKNAIAFDYRLLHFDTMEHAKHWMIENQLGRRNLTPEQSSYLRGLRYESEKKENRGATQILNKGTQEQATSERIAKEHNVSEKTIKRDAKFAQGIDKIGKKNPELKKALLSGKIKVKKSDIQALANITVEKLGEVRSVEDIAVILKNVNRKQNLLVKGSDLEGVRSSIIQALDEVVEKQDETSLKQLTKQVNSLKKLLSV